MDRRCVGSDNGRFSMVYGNVLMKALTSVRTSAWFEAKTFGRVDVIAR